MFRLNPRKLPEGIDSWFDLPENHVSQEFIQTKKIIISDCDGIITDSKSVYGSSGKMFKTYGAYDKEAIEHLINNCGWKFYFVTDDRSGLNITFARLKHLKNGFPNDQFMFDNVGRRERVNLIKKYNNDGYVTVFIGDSISDIPSLSKATYSGCTANSPSVVKEYCHFISQNNGSDGGFADLLLELNAKIYQKILNENPL